MKGKRLIAWLSSKIQDWTYINGLLIMYLKNKHDIDKVIRYSLIVQDKKYYTIVANQILITYPTNIKHEVLPYFGEIVDIFDHDYTILANLIYKYYNDLVSYYMKIYDYIQQNRKYKSIIFYDIFSYNFNMYIILYLNKFRVSVNRKHLLRIQIKPIGYTPVETQDIDMKKMCIEFTSPLYEFYIDGTKIYSRNLHKIIYGFKRKVDASDLGFDAIRNMEVYPNIDELKCKHS